MALDNKRDAAIETMPRDGMNIIDTDRYPLDQPDSDVLLEMIAQARAGLEMDGCARLSGFIRPAAHRSPRTAVKSILLMGLAQMTVFRQITLVAVPTAPPAAA